MSIDFAFSITIRVVDAANVVMLIGLH